MKKLLRPKDILLLCLAGGLDIYQDLKDPFGLVMSGYESIYGWVPRRYKKNNFSRVVQRGIRTGEIEKVVRGGEVYLRLTSAGNDKVFRDFPLMPMQNRKWDRKWRVVVFDISELSRFVRDNLREKLKELGFGMLQESVWISPHDIITDFREFLEEKKLADSVYLMELSNLLAGNIENLVERVWRVKGLNEEYQELLSEILALKNMYVMSNDRYRKHTPGYEDEVNRLREKYLSILLKDPMLPNDLLPKNWSGSRVKIEVVKL